MKWNGKNGENETKTRKKEKKTEKRKRNHEFCVQGSGIDNITHTERNYTTLTSADVCLNIYNVEKTATQALPESLVDTLNALA